MTRIREKESDFAAIARWATALYLAIGVAWVAVSEWLLPSAAMRQSVINRSGFVAATAVTLYLVTTEYGRRMKRLKGELEEAVVEAKAYFQSAQWGIVSVRETGEIRAVNPKACEMFGYSDSEMIGQSIEMLIPERMRIRHVAHRANYAAEPRNRPMGIGMDLIGRRKDGAEFPIEVSLNQLHVSGEPVVSAFISDITERLKLEREARRGETLTALGAVAAGVAHELNNPLAVVSSRVELMLQAGAKELSPQMREDLEVVHRNARRASRIASELLNSARQRRPERRPVNLAELVDETLLLFREQMRRDGISVTTAFPAGLAPVLGDRSALAQVLINLLTNARDAIAKNGGAVRITGSAPTDRPDFARLRIEDSGPGIPAEARERIFDVFFTTKANGTGLGLWLCRRIVLEHQGNIEVESEPGRGAAFTITLPAAGDHTDAPHGHGEAGGAKIPAPPERG